jgi:hypothetical protein
MVVHLSLGQDNYSISQPVKIKIDEGAKSASLSEPIHVTVGFTVSKVAGISTPVPVKVRAESQAVLQTQVARSQSQSANSSVMKEQPAISGVPSYRALIIAEESYHPSSGLVALNQPVKDASKLYLALTGKYNFTKEQTTLLKNPSRSEILQALEDLSKKVTSKENVIIFYAGHGIWDERLKVGYWLPSDAKSSDKSNWIANSTIRDYIAGIEAKHTLLITDACFSGSIF